VLPDGYRTLLGYDSSNLQAAQAQQVQGTLAVYQATVPTNCEIVGLTNFSFSMRPLFVPGALNALWGRLDFLAACCLEIDEPHQRFYLTLPGTAKVVAPSGQSGAPQTR
jgi:hypothetical protein